jgi:hypothetical protein
MAEQYLSTSRLGNVIRLIGLGRQTGLLRVVRGQGATREEGEVQFIEGTIANATVGQLTGSAALAVLQQWGESWYLFLDGVNRLQQTNTSQSLGWGAPPDAMPPAGSGSYPSAPYTGVPPGYASQPLYGSNPGSSQPPFGSNPGSSQPPYSSNPGNSQPYYGPGYGPDYGNGSNPNGYATSPMNSPSGGMGGGSGPLPPSNRPFDSGSLPGQGYPSGPQVVPPQVMQRLADYSAILRRLSTLNPIEMPRLDRRERQMLLLIDNRRTIADLVRLTRRSDDEIRAILAHLIVLGLVE